MACAVGGCAGCAVPVVTESGLAMKRVCVDGPVFDANAVYPPAPFLFLGTDPCPGAGECFDKAIYEERLETLSGARAAGI